MKIYWQGEGKNIVGSKVRALRLKQRMTQRELASRLQLAGWEFTDLTILRIEKRMRFVPDYEIKALATVLKVSYTDLLGE